MLGLLVGIWIGFGILNIVVWVNRLKTIEPFEAIVNVLLGPIPLISNLLGFSPSKERIKELEKRVEELDA